MVVKSLTSMPNKRLGWEKSKRVIRRQLWSNISLYNISCMWISTVSEENKVYLLGRRNSNSVFKSEPSNLGSFLPGHQQGSYQLPVGFWESLPPINETKEPKKCKERKRWFKILIVDYKKAPPVVSKQSNGKELPTDPKMTAAVLPIEHSKTSSPLKHHHYFASLFN